VGKREKFLERLLLGQSDANTDFDDLCALLRELGFEERIKGSHHIFRREAIHELINLQSDGKQAKIYQVRQVRDIILRYGLRGE
jgi:predicted RNA binding protein YcfA (HicA-like mRNA interferase family)